MSAADRKRILGLVIPPAWTDVWICADEDGHLQATGRDVAGRKQYLYHPDWRETRDDDKFSSLARFGAELGELRAAVHHDLARPRWDRLRVSALAVRLLDHTLLRIGGVAYAEDNESYGLTTLMREHVASRPGCVEMCFPGKSGVEQTCRVDDPDVVPLLRRCLRLNGPGVLSYRASGELVALRAADVNDYLAERSGAGTTARDFRTWGASALVTGLLAPKKPGDDADAAVAEAERSAADMLGNTVAVARSAYIHPGLAEAHRSGELHERWLKTRAGTRVTRAERCLTGWLA